MSDLRFAARLLRRNPGSTLAIAGLLALGAEAMDIAALTTRRTLAMAATGIAVRLAGGLAAAPLIRSLLYGVSPQDPASLAGAALFVLLVAAIATAVPATRAMHVQPAAALQEN